MATISGEQKTWHKVTLDFEVPETFREEASTFRDHRLDVTFTNAATGTTITVPGYFAADGDAANTGATEGNIWRVNFNPPEAGDWTYEVSFREGNDIAATPYEDAPNAGQPVTYLDGETGTVAVTETDKTGEDFRAKGMLLQDEGTHYLQHQGDGDYFVRGGPGVPENFLASQDIDNTPTGRHDYASHLDDFNAGDPTWDGGKGQGLLGTINYLEEQGQNTIYVMTLTAAGDGQDIWPWAATDLNELGKNTRNLDPDITSVYDVSKLDQWGILFDHMDEKGIYKNVLLQETENDQLLDGGTSADGSSLSVERMIYMREMVARYGHNNGIQWNIGEENTNTNQQVKDMASYLKAVDGYDHLVTMHTFPGDTGKYNNLTGFEDFDGPSLQTGPADGTREKFQEFLEKSAAAGDPWVMTWDEASGGNAIIDPGSNNPDSTNERALREEFWGTLTVGGSGGNWYIKQSNGHSFDQNIDFFDQHTSLWTWTAAATDFFNTHIPFWEMEEKDELTSDNDDFVMAKDGEYYVVYLPYGEAGNVQLNLNGHGGETFDVFWYNPREGGDLIADGTVEGGAVRQLGGAPEDGGKDWVLFLRNSELPGDPGVGAPDPDPDPQPDPDPDPQPAGDPVFEMQDGRVVMQAEAGTFVYENNGANANWDLTTDLGGKGDGVMLWTGNDFFNGSNAGQPQTAPLEYQFTVDEPGTYYISLRSIRPETGEPGDRNNDFFVQFEDTGWKKVFFSGARETFQWGTTYDVNHQKSPSTFEVTQAMIDANDGVFTLGISGRSRQAGLDEIHIQKDGFSRDHNAPTSPLVDGATPPDVPDTPDNPTPPPTGDADITLYLVDAATDERVGTITPGGTVDLSELSTGAFSIEAVADSGAVGSARLTYNGSSQTENVAPYALFGDTNGDFEGETLTAGDHTVTVAFFSGANGSGTRLGETTVSFTAADAPPPNAAPEADRDAATVDAGGTVRIDVLDNDTDADGDPLTITDVTAPANGTAVIEGGTVVYKPAAGFSGDDAFRYTVSDGQGNTDTAIVDVTVEAAPAPDPDPQPDPDPDPQPDPGGDEAITLYLLDPVTDERIGELADGMEVDISALTDGQFSVEAVPESGEATRVRLTLDDGATRTEGMAPYALFGDIGDDITGRTLEPGDHSVAVTVLGANGQTLATRTVAFTAVEEAVDSGTGPSPFTIHLVDAGSDTLVEEIEEGDMIDLSGIDTGAQSLAVFTDNAEVESIALSLNGGRTQVESFSPYALFGDIEGDYRGGTLGDGPQELTIRAYSEDGGRGELIAEQTLTFETDALIA
ncbi:Ig-like domain-containing protein [Pontivivens ytuae]|uniref:DUF5060 domain-containing protein n=1 Tax=Pontivivens ytuae TaxID=2789856 RepID=A0A7S9QDZ8_9RHOB|nr:Ig-like domain-containing protein [Pontivivens ytuae]QPH54877.1 DUF5060 domain-containing protein [Pontivivens ytuae]